jgi:PAS domain S-box-containing protein
MNEGALMLSPGAMILYANRRFATMVGRPLRRVLGRSLRRFLADADQKALVRALRLVSRPLPTLQVLLLAPDGSQVPAQVSIRRLARTGAGSAGFSMVVTDMREARRSERTLRRLSHSLLRAQETDRRRLALELHDRAAQNLGSLLIHLRVLAKHLPARPRSVHREVVAIRALATRTATVVESISRNLRPGVLEILGLVPALQVVTTEFAKRTGLPARLACAGVPGRLSPEVELVLYRVLEEALLNVEQHANASNVTVRLSTQGSAVVLSIQDDGVGCNPVFDRPRRRTKGGIGLIGLRERVAYVGGTLEIKSTRGAGTRVTARIPLRLDVPPSLPPSLPQSPSSSPIDLRSSTRSQTDLIITMIGTASNNPQIPHIHPQNINPRNSAGPFMRIARPMSHGFSKEPSRIVMIRNRPARETPIRIVPNWRKPIVKMPPMPTAGPK